jgi:hypothetical protein
MKERKPHYHLDELLKRLEKGEFIIPEDVFISVVYAIKDVKYDLENLDNEFRGYDP